MVVQKATSRILSILVVICCSAPLSVHNNNLVGVGIGIGIVEAFTHCVPNRRSPLSLSSSSSSSSSSLSSSSWTVRNTRAVSPLDYNKNQRREKAKHRLSLSPKPFCPTNGDGDDEENDTTVELEQQPIMTKTVVPAPTKLLSLHDPVVPFVVGALVVVAASLVGLPQGAYASAVTSTTTTTATSSSINFNSMAIGAGIVNYAHVVSVMTITGCLVAERLLFRTNMTQQDEDVLIKIDFVYGLLAVLLIGSGFAQAIRFGKGGDFYIHQVLFWLKMTFAGVWGGLSAFPSVILFRRKKSRDNNQDLAETNQPIQFSEALVARLHSIINAELSALLSIPLLASLMSRGVGYSQSFPWEAGAVISVGAMLASFGYYGWQALSWSDTDLDS